MTDVGRPQSIAIKNRTDFYHISDSKIIVEANPQR